MSSSARRHPHRYTNGTNSGLNASHRVRRATSVSCHYESARERPSLWGRPPLGQASYPVGRADGCGQTSPRVSANSAAGGSGADVHNMLEDLSNLSHGIAAYLQRSPSVTDSETGHSKGHQAALKAQEIERVVKRVAAHFAGKLATLESVRQAQEQEILYLRRQLRALQSKDKAAVGSAIGGGISPREEFCIGTHSASGTDVDKLRSVLLAEKRQRLCVEEQTHSLAEQNVKAVTTLERRLRKQEEQLRDLTLAVERSTHSSVTRVSTPRGASDALEAPPIRITPRRLLRQQAAYHQSTSQEQPQPAPVVHSTSKAPTAVDECTNDAGRTPLSIPARQSLSAEVRVSKPALPRVTSVPSLQQHAGGVSPKCLIEVDEISTFLDAITRELEGISATEQRPRAAV